MLPRPRYLCRLIVAGAALATSSLLAATPAAQKKGPPSAPPQQLSVTLSDIAPAPGVSADTVTSDGLGPYEGVTSVDGAIEGAFINSAGGIELRLFPGGFPRGLRFTFEPAGPINAVPCAPASGSELLASTVELRFNVQDASGKVLGVEWMFPGQAIQGGDRDSTGVDIGASLQFGDQSLEKVFPIGRSPAVTLARTSVDSWHVEVDAPEGLLLRCTVPAGGKRVRTYDVGLYRVQFALDAVMWPQQP